MALAAIGAAATMLGVAAIHWRLDPAFVAELRASLRIERGDAPLGEQALRAMLARRRARRG